MSNEGNGGGPDYDVVRRVVRSRKTAKVLADPDRPVDFDEATRARLDPLVREAILEAGWAPFHYNRAHGGLAEPWRVHLLFQKDCRKVAECLEGWSGDLAPVGKLPSMFAACGAAALITWVPQFRTGGPGAESGKQQAVDDEHLAASASLVQNALLLLTAAGFGTYWSSGGAALREPGIAARLGIDAQESLLALLFVDYPGSPADLSRKPGKNRDLRSDGWLREVSLS